MLNHFFHLTLTRKAALIASLLATISCIVIVLAGYHGSKQLIHNSARVFGESLIQQLSREASNPLVQNDKLSLQSLLNELVNSPVIIHAVIYDVENNPIVEAGQQYDGLSLSASITFQDSIAGYVVITINSQSLQSQAYSLAWQLIGLTGLLVIFIYLLSAIPARYVSALLDDLTVVAASSQRQKSLHTVYRGEDELQRLAQQILLGPDKNNSSSINKSELAIVSLEATNLVQLQQQLSKQVVKKLLSESYEQLAIICKLYDGQIAISGPNRFSACFYPTDDDNSHPFRALCVGYLIQQWIKISNCALSIDIGLALKEKSTDNNTVSYDAIENELAVQEIIEQAKSAGNTHKESVVTTCALYQHPSVNNRVKLLESCSNDLFQVIDKFNEPYQALLISQLDALSTQFQR